MKFGWYYNRFKLMGIGEVIWRLCRLFWQINTRLFRKLYVLKYKRNSAEPSQLLSMFEKCNFYGLSNIKPENVPQEWGKSTIAAAEKLLQHQYNYFALGEIDLGKKINWNHEYKRDIDTPLLFGPWMDYRDTNAYGDFKYFWELPRFQHLIMLAKAYYLTGEEKYAKEVIEQIKSFIEQSPYLLGVNWIMPMEAGIRLISLCWITAFLKNFLKKDTQVCRMIESLIVSHTDYVTRNYAAYSSANNHLVGEAAGVFVAAICFGGLKKRMSSYGRQAYDILCREIICQHYDDGVNKEQAVHYQVFAFNFLLLAGLLGRANGIEFPCQYWKMLDKSATFIAAIADDNCLLPEIGDSDDGRAMVLLETDYNPVRSILAISAILFKRNDFKSKAGIFDETSFWMLGNAGKAEFDSLKGKTKPLSTVNKFEHGGYYILNSNGKTKARIIFDCGPLGFGSIAAHGHADSLSFILNCYDRPYFVDPGSYTYVADNPYRNYFRSTAAHNTIVIDSCDQSQITGPFLWATKANSFVQEWQDNDAFAKVTGWHDGYRRLSDPVTHRRDIEFDKNNAVVVIRDFIESMTSHTVEQFFHLSPECVASQLDMNRFRIINGDAAIELLTDERVSVKTRRAEENPISGWASRSYDRKEPTTTIACRTACTGNQCLTTRIILSTQG